MHVCWTLSKWIDSGISPCILILNIKLTVPNRCLTSIVFLEIQNESLIGKFKWMLPLAKCGYYAKKIYIVVRQRLWARKGHLYFLLKSWQHAIHCYIVIFVKWHIQSTDINGWVLWCFEDLGESNKCVF